MQTETRWKEFPETSRKYIQWIPSLQLWQVRVTGHLKSKYFPDLAQAIQYRDQTPPKNTAVSILNMNQLRN